MSAQAYHEFLATKLDSFDGVGVEPEQMPEHLKPHQRVMVDWALRKGRYCIFADTGLGKTCMFLEWARQVSKRGRVLILAPLGVTSQHVAEGVKWGVHVEYDATGTSDARIVVTNYDRLHKFDARAFVGIILDESSILKSFTGKIRTAIIDTFATTPYRLACSATPAPNDHTELGNHAEFMGVLTRTEMLARYFIHDGGNTQAWRLKGHAVDDFWSWVCTWAALVRVPSDLGFDDEGYTLPERIMLEEIVPAPRPDIGDVEGTQGQLFAEARTLTDQRSIRRETLHARVNAAAALLQDVPCAIVWCELNAESEVAARVIPGAAEVTGSGMSREEKLATLDAFSRGEIRVLVTKPSIAGFGMNWQHCGMQVFLGASHSYEQTYQAIRRSHRFGRTEPVTIIMIRTDADDHIVRNYQRKEQDALTMAAKMSTYMRQYQQGPAERLARAWTAYTPTKPLLFNGAHMPTNVLDSHHGPSFDLYHGDCVEVLGALPDDTIGYQIFSPPFSSLYTYSASVRDMGNTSGDGQFFEQYQYLIREQYRVTVPGRLVSFHCMNLPTLKARDGYIGLRDFRGELIRAYIDAGWIFHSEHVIWKDPVQAMQRTKALGLLYKQLRKDSAMSRAGIPDYLVTMRKPGNNPVPIGHRPEEFPVQEWQKYASPVWMDIDPSDTLQHRSARDEQDERHICPLQLEVIRRGLRLYSVPDDRVLSPFAGIGSEGVVSLEMGRRFVGVELKESYYRQAAANLDAASAPAAQTELMLGPSNSQMLLDVQP